MTVRLAKLDEISKFYELWEAFLDEHNPVAGVQIDKTKRMDQGGRLFQTYVGGAKKGACHFWLDKNDVVQGIMLVGEPLGFFDMFDDLENCAITYAIYIRKEYRGEAGAELVAVSEKAAEDMGFTCGCTVVKAGNTKGISIIERSGGVLLDMRYYFP
jgi:hypothetical protein